MSSNQKGPKKICDEVKEAYNIHYADFREDDIPVFLEYEHLPQKSVSRKASFLEMSLKGT